MEVYRRFHVRFYVTFLDGASTSAGFSHGAKEDFVPTPDGGQEVISARFVHPIEALRAFRAKEMKFMPPQYYLLSTLADILSGNRNSEAQRVRVRKLSEGPFGRMVVLPRQSKIGDGRVMLAYEGDEFVGGEAGARHRSTITPGPGGVSSKPRKGVNLGLMWAQIPTEIDLQRNIDVFKTGVSTRDAKL